MISMSTKNGRQPYSPGDLKSASALALNLSQQGSDRAPPLLNLRQI